LTRRLPRSLFAGPLAGLLACLLATGAALSPPLRASELAAGVELIPGKFTPGTQPDGNTLVLAGADALVVIDSGRHREHTQRIVDFARATGAPVRFLVNTHWHLDHAGGNRILREAFPGVSVLASAAMEGALEGFLARYRTQLEDLVARAPNEEAARTYRDERAILDAAPALRPDEVVTASGLRTLAGRVLDVHLERAAVTAGDLWIVDVASGTLVAGDLVTLPAPLFDTACPARWSEALGRLAAADFRILVPGHGAPMDRAQLGLYRQGFDALLECSTSPRPKEECVEGWLSDAAPLLPEEDRQLARSLLDYYVGAVLRAPAEQVAERCGA
jgi:glyoxylase-like metal-dependent hydrolase (beta-lactamase superfamily II)